MNRLLSTTMSLAVVAGMAFAGSQAFARDIRAAPSLPPAHPAYGILYTKMAEYLDEATQGGIKLQLLGPEVVDAKGMKSALSSGLAELGNLLPLYNPSDLPNFSSAGDLALLGRDAAAMSAAMSEFIVTCADCQAELSRNGFVFFTSSSTDPYVLLTTKPVRDVADLQGMRLRSGGAPFSRWAESVGATPVNLTLGDTFEAMSQGVIDGTITSVGDLITMRLIDLTKYITDVKLGTYAVSSNFTLKQSVWQDMTLEERTAFAKAAERAAAIYAQKGYTEAAASAREAAVAAGIEIITPSDALTQQINDFAQADVTTAEKVAAERFNVTGAPEKFAHYQELVKKWEKISADVGDDHEKMAEIRFQEIWGKVDLMTYGQ